ncbi:helix-turn-helix transcriptional regulator [Amycolatopsis sp. FDAARGOS 1241]|uniref:helix-turn-helix domain-containing protein n=1 Tax=Amycolatopsis sp. FDAARGOS 1241 TaxID=2778070 RepID=UPI001951A78B|nr:helix-turn-helix transcriptional regulator [Amycolatopsis sp. FDAARGOS 1241]QRP47347.1 helix-turn-helix transcriptional regulator [Amycolatopsis sp. FDAARGOS 1241]
MDAHEALSAQVEMARTRLEEVREARGWTLANIQEMTGMPSRVTAARWWYRAPQSHGLHALGRCAHELGHAIRLLLVEDDPDARHRPWRDRMPHTDHCLTADPDAAAKAEPWRLQTELRQARIAAGKSRADLAAALGTSVIHVWRLEHSPSVHESALCDFLMYARLLSYTVRLELAHEKGPSRHRPGRAPLAHCLFVDLALGGLRHQ